MELLTVLTVLNFKQFNILPKVSSLLKNNFYVIFSNIAGFGIYKALGDYHFFTFKLPPPPPTKKVTIPFPAFLYWGGGSEYKYIWRDRKYQFFEDAWQV